MVVRFLGMDIANPWLVWLAGALAVGLPIAVALRWALGRRPITRLARVLGALTTVVAIVAAQSAALLGVFLYANQKYGFYNTWGELLGVETTTVLHDLKPPKGSQGPIVKVPISPNNPHPNGLLTHLQVPPAQANFGRVEVWLPPAYFEKSQSLTAFPVMMVVGSMKTDGLGAARIFQADTLNQRMIEQGKASPFIAVYVGGAVIPGFDSECTDLPQVAHLTYLTETVPKAIQRHYRASGHRSKWFITGASSGGYCAAAATFLRPGSFAAGAGIAPYFHPLYDDSRLAGDAATVAKYSVLDLVRRGQNNGAQFLTVSSKKDTEAWGDPVADPTGKGPDTALFVRYAQSLPGMSFILLESGGHNLQVWQPYLGDVISWFGQRGL